MAQRRLNKTERKEVKQLRDNKRNKKSAWDNLETQDDLSLSCKLESMGKAIWQESMLNDLRAYN
jgi:hypothetical protein